MLNDFYNIHALPHRVQVKHGRLEFCELYGCDADRPDVTLLVVPSFSFHGCHLGGHPEKSNDFDARAYVVHTMY